MTTSKQHKNSVPTEWILLVWLIKYVVTVTIKKEFT